MKKIVTVTILGTLAAWVFLLAACGSSGKQVQQEESPKVEAPRPQVDPEAAVIEVEVAEGRRCYEEGDLQQAARIVNGILARRPQHAGANALNEKLRAVPFCTVYPGDTLGVIAGYYYRDPKQWGILARANGISDPKKLKAYQRLRIPPPDLLVALARDGALLDRLVEVAGKRRLVARVADIGPEEEPVLELLQERVPELGVAADGVEPAAGR